MKKDVRALALGAFHSSAAGEQNEPARRSSPCLSMLGSLSACVTVLFGLLIGSLHAEETVPASAESIRSLINRLGTDVSSDAITRSRLRAMLAQDRASPASAPGRLQEEIWVGVVERVYVDHMDAQGNLKPGPTQFYLLAGDERLRIFFMNQAEADAASGKRLKIKGYRTGRRALVLDTLHNKRESDRRGKGQRRSDHR